MIPPERASVAPREQAFANYVATGQHMLAILPSMKALLAQLRADLAGAKAAHLDRNVHLPLGSVRMGARA